MKEVCFSLLLLLLVDLLTLVQLVTRDQNYCLVNPVRGFTGNAIHACKENTASGDIVAMDISQFTGTDCICQLGYTGDIDDHAFVGVSYRTPNKGLSHRIGLYAIYQNNDTEGLNETTTTLKVSSGVPTKILVRNKLPRTLREGKLCLSFKLPEANEPESLNLTCFNGTVSEPDLNTNTENPTPVVVKPQSTQIATTVLETTPRRTSTTTPSPTTHTTTTVVQRTTRRTSITTASQTTNKKISLGATTTVASSLETVTTPEVEQISDVTEKYTATIKYTVTSENTQKNEDKSTPAIQAGTVRIIIIVAVVVVVCIVTVVLVVNCLKRRKRHASKVTVSQQSTRRIDEDYEITENAMYVPHIPTNDRNGDYDHIYEEAEIDINQSGKEAISLLQDHEISRKDVDPIDNTLK